MTRMYTLVVLAAFLSAAGVRAADAANPASVPDKVTFSEHVAPLVFSKCTLCHRPGEAAPFTLMNYSEVRKHASTLLRAITKRIMPPWSPEPGYGDFRDDRRLTGVQIAVFKKWVETGLAEGDPAKTPKPPNYSGGWVLGQPDLVVSMEQSFDVPEGGPDLYRNFVLPTKTTEDKWVSAVAFQTTSPSVVHHLLYFVDGNHNARKLDGKDGQPGFSGMGFRGTGGLGGWAVGAMPHRLPQGLAHPLPADADLVVQTHFHPTGKAEKCKLTIGLYFSPTKPARTLISFQVPPAFGMFAGLDIPPGTADYSVRESFTLPVDVDVVRVSPHAHYIGKILKADAKLPDGTIKPLIWIKDWDFAWQGTYEYKQFIRLPKGTEVRGEVHWDNSSDNPRNPNFPPIRVTWGEGSNDEMGSVVFAVVPADEKDLPALRTAIRQKVVNAYRAAVKRGFKFPREAFGVRELIEKQKTEPPSKQKTSSLPDLDGKLQQPLKVDGAKANVLFFLQQDCPISMSYSPEIKALVKNFQDQPVRFFGVLVDPDVTVEAGRKYARDFGLSFPVVVDRKHELVKVTGVTITPEAAVLTADGGIAYRGRIDDMYVDWGKRRNAPTQRNLRDALGAVLAGQPVTVARTEAIGCYIEEVR